MASFYCLWQCVEINNNGKAKALSIPNSGRDEMKWHREEIVDINDGMYTTKNWYHIIMLNNNKAANNGDEERQREERKTYELRQKVLMANVLHWTLAYDASLLVDSQAVAMEWRPIGEGMKKFSFTHFYFICAIASEHFSLSWVFAFSLTSDTSKVEWVVARHTVEWLFNIQEAFARNIDWHFVYICFEAKQRCRREKRRREEKAKLFKY